MIPYFGGASYVYMLFIKPYFCVNSRLLDVILVSEEKESEQNSFLGAPETLNTEEEKVKLVISEVV